MFISLFVFSGIKLINYIKDGKQNEKVFDEISKYVQKDYLAENSEKDKDVNKYKIDFAGLKEKNNDAVAFIKVNGTDIENVVVKAKDNSYYLNHNFNKQANIAGWIFADYRNKFDGTDRNIIIYGHNMKNGTMFSSLKNLLNNDWKENEENTKVLLVTENETCIYEVFSEYQTDAEDYYMKTEFNPKDFGVFANKLKNRSKFDFGVDVEDNDSILTLSTCGSNSNERVVLHAKKIPYQ